jgi:hypothetical protein
MSLNRRLYAWLLGSDLTPQAQLNYFHHFAEKATTQAIQNLLFTTSYANYHQEEFDNGTNTDFSLLVTDAQKPYKILISLMDKWEIGQPIVNNIFTDSLISLQGYGQYGLAEQEVRGRLRGIHVLIVFSFVDMNRYYRQQTCGWKWWNLT